MRSLGRDLSFALRQFLRNPGFTFTVIATLTLAIGANTAIFSVVNGLMLQHLPYPQPERIGTIFRLVQGGTSSFDARHSINGEVWEQLRDNVPSLQSAVSSGRADGVNLQAGEHAEYVRAGRISDHYLDVLGIHPALGRNFSDAEDRPHGPKAVILSYALWHTVFGEDPHLIGQTIHLKGEAYAVVGILPVGATTPLNADLYTALQPSRDGEGGGSNYEVITRLREGATWQQADAEINRTWADWAKGLASQYGPGARVSFYSVPLQRGESAFLRPQALALMFAAGFILLIGCANLAGLTLVRMTRRAPEFATRLALGGARWQVQKQLWTENVLLAAIGGAFGIAVGFIALRALLSLLPENFLPIADIHLDSRVLLFTVIVSVGTSVLFGVLPSLSVGRFDLRSTMKSRTIAGGERLHLRQALIACEVALTVVLLAGSGLLIRTLIHLETLPPGFNASGVIAGKASLDDVHYHDPAEFRRLLSESVAAMRQIPGVESAAVGLSLPYERVLNDAMTLSDGKETGQQIQADTLYVTPGYFATLQMPLLAGRDFAAGDGPDAQRVAVVNQSFARRFYHGANPVGRTLGGNSKTVIVGMVSDVQISSGLNPVAPLQSEETVYIPASQMTQAASLALVHTWFQPSWVVRTARPVEGLTAKMQTALSGVAPNLPFSGFYSMSDLMAKALTVQRVEVALLGTMAGLALLLSTIGISALVASLVAQRTREIGIRMALGSSTRQAMAHMANPALRASILGIVLGLGACAVALRVMQSVLYGVSAYDWPSLAGVIGTLGAVAMAASVVPALRIAKIDPATTLRDE